MNTTVKNKFELFCKVYNLRTRANVTTIQDNPGQSTFYSNDFVKMDYAPAYGGYRIGIVHTYTAESFFDSSSRLSAKEMIAYLNGLLAAKAAYKFESIVNL